MSLIKQAKHIIDLAWPIVVSQLALAGMITTDTIMSSHYSAIDMAAIGTALGIWQPISLFALGVIVALSPILSRDYGANDKTAAAKHLSNGVVLTLGLSIACFIIMISCASVLLDLLNLEPKLKSITEQYLFYLALGMPGFCLFILFRVLNESFGNTKIVMYLHLGAFLLNIPFNTLFIFGNNNLGPFSISALGGAGCGISTTSLHYLLMLVMMVYSFKHSSCQSYLNRLSLSQVNWSQIKSFLHLGLPVGFTLFFEVALFGAVALSIASHGSMSMAAHQIAISISANVYMLPLSLSIAMTVIISQYLGAKAHDKAQQSLYAGLLLSITFACFTAMLSYFGRDLIIDFYTDEPAVAAIATGMLLWTALFQISDALQCVTQGALRGLKDTKIPMLLTLIAYWLIGYPVGWLLAETAFFGEQLGIIGYWIGLFISLTTAAFFMALRLVKIGKLSFKKTSVKA